MSEAATQVLAGPGTSGDAARIDTVVLFPGQGSQRPGMEALVERYEPELTADARALLGDGVLATQESSPRLLQPAIYCASLAGWRRIEELDARGVLPLRGRVAFAGHSLGEFAALAAAGALDPRTGLELVALRGALMEEASESYAEGSLLAIRGEQARELAADAARSGAFVANDNTPRQVVVAGPDEALERADRLVRAAGARSRRLPVRGALHSPAMAAVSPRLRAALDAAEVTTPATQVWSSTTARPFTDVRRELAEAVARPVCWRQLLVELHRRGALSFVETGPGRVLSGLVGGTLAEVEIRAACDFDAEEMT